MNILLFGVSNVGKTTIGKILAQQLKYDFYDLDEEVKKYYKVTLEEFVNTDSLRERDGKRGVVIERILKQEQDKIFAISHISHPEYFNHYLFHKDIIAIDLLDTPENIFERLVFSDENDNIYEDRDYKEKHRNYYISEIIKDILHYEKVYSYVRNKFFVNNDPPKVAAKRLIREFHLI